MQAILQGEIPSSTLGLPATIPQPSGGVASFQQPAGGGLEVLGQFNGVTNTSLYCVKPLDQVWDGYYSGTSPASGYYTPSRHVLLVSTARYPNMPSSTHMSMFTSNFAYGLLAPKGIINVNGDARSSVNNRGNDSDESGRHGTHVRAERHHRDRLRERAHAGAVGSHQCREQRREADGDHRRGHSGRLHDSTGHGSHAGDVRTHQHRSPHRCPPLRAPPQLSSELGHHGHAPAGWVSHHAIQHGQHRHQHHHGALGHGPEAGASSTVASTS